MYGTSEIESLNLVAPINFLGYGIASTQIAKALNEKVRQLAVFPIGDRIEAEPENHGWLKTVIPMKAGGSPQDSWGNTPDFFATTLKIWHANDMEMMGRGSHIGFPIFELDTFTPIECHHLFTGCDYIFVCSEWAREIVKQNSDDPILGESIRHNGSVYHSGQTSIKATDDNIFVVPLGVDRKVFYDSPIHYNSKDKQFTNKTPTIFLNVGKWEIRKGHDVLVKIFNEAFTEEDDVELWMLNHNIFYTDKENKEWEDMYLKSPLGHKIKIIPRKSTIREVSDLMRAADCGIFPSRGEGWNLEALEMLSCGRHLIVTDYSGHTEFCTAKNSRLIPINTIESAFDGKWFNQQGNWGLFGDRQMQATVNYMKDVHKLKQQGKLEVNHEGIKTAKHFTWENTANCILEALKTIKGR